MSRKDKLKQADDYLKQLVQKAGTPAPPAPAVTLALNGNAFSWTWSGTNPQSWKLWKIPSSLNPTTANFQAWRNQSSDSSEVDGGTRTVSFAAESGYSYALCAYDDVNDVALAPASNVIAVP